jgi:ArsR family transcriptional regulator, arsenate/arsenite/antimonite-responsive transcriptional repressor
MFASGLKIKPMALSKTNLFNKELQEKANLFKTLAHPVRLQILQHLAETKTCLSGDISDIFPLTRTTLNQHMKELKDSGLIVGHEVGAKIVYCLNCKKIRKLREILIEFSDLIDLPEDFSCEYLLNKNEYLTIEN